MNSLLETRSSPVPSAPPPSRPSRSTVVDRLALRLGLALVIWGRRHTERALDHVADRAGQRDRAVAGFVAELARRERELAAQRRLLLEPRAR